MNYPKIFKLVAIGGAIGIVVSAGAHWSKAVLLVAGPVGALVSLIMGVVAGRGTPSWGHGAVAGALTGLCTAFIGILSGLLLRDQGLPVLLGGTVGGLVSGAVGGLIGRATKKG